MEGVLKSWALPKGPSMNPAEKRLAILVDDHPLEYKDFEGVIPAGRPGAGPVLLWDRGAYRVSEGRNPTAAFNAGKMVIELFGDTLKGRFTLLKMKGRGDKNWLFIKGRDEHSRSHWILQKAMTKERESQLQERIPPCDSTRVW
jgi:bifunctional non-homologous end joining protein LigD